MKSDRNYDEWFLTVHSASANSNLALSSTVMFFCFYLIRSSVLRLFRQFNLILVEESQKKGDSSPGCLIKTNIAYIFRMVCL